MRVATPAETSQTHTLPSAETGTSHDAGGPAQPNAKDGRPTCRQCGAPQPAPAQKESRRSKSDDDDDDNDDDEEIQEVMKKAKARVLNAFQHAQIEEMMDKSLGVKKKTGAKKKGPERKGP